MKTYDVIFNDGTNDSYFDCYKGGIASVVCNENGDTVYEIPVQQCPEFF